MLSIVWGCHVMNAMPWSGLPPFTADGVLPRGDYPLTLDELLHSHLVTGTVGSAATWDGRWRAQLVQNLSIVVAQLWAIGIDRIFVDGSFVEAKDHPNDIDGYFECDARYFGSGQLESDLNAHDPHQSWTWDPARRVWDPNAGKAQLPIWHRYRVELYPHFAQLKTNIVDQFGNQMPFPAAFRVSRRAYTPKGIIQIVR